MVFAHEFGHSFNVFHSRENNSAENIGEYSKDEYGDETCTMGHAFLKNQVLLEGKGLNPSHSPLPVCFNGSKSWYFGWYEDQHITFSAVDQKWEGKLIGQVDYPAAPDGDGTVYTVVLKLENIFPEAKEDLYVMFHRVPGSISGEYDNSNKVSVVQSDKAGSGVSHLKATLGASGEYISPSFNGQGQDLKLTVKSINVDQAPAYAEVVVEILGQPTLAPTSAPTKSSPPPTPAPSTSIPSSSMPVLAVPTTNVPLAPSTNFPTFDNIIDDDDDRTVSEK